jgi:hypothetical protein
MNRSYYTAIFALLLFWGCAVPPTMKDVEEITADANIVFGSVEVYEDGELQEWGTRFFGYDHFYLTILPPDSNESITYKLAKGGTFFWSLPPGKYTLLGYHWSEDTGQRSGRIGASFSVPESGPSAYLGTIEFRGNVVYLVPKFEDKFDQVVKLYDTKFPDRQGTAVKQLMEAPQPVGSFAAYRGQCHDDWKIECDKRFRGVTPISPEVSKSGFPMSDTLRPEFRWKACARQDVSYDLILYEAAAYVLGGQNVPSYMKGRVVAYEEDLKEPRWQPDTPLKPDTRYIWSVRLRDGDTVSGWSTQSHSTFLLVYMSSGYGQWFQFKTA